LYPGIFSHSTSSANTTSISIICHNGQLSHSGSQTVHFVPKASEGILRILRIICQSVLFYLFW